MFLLPGSNENDAGEPTVFGESDNFTVTSAYLTRILASKGPGMARFTQNKLSRVFHSKCRIAEVRNIVCVRGLSDGQGYHRSGP